MVNDLDFTGKVALVTGGRRGLGKAMADALAERGAKVVVIARSEGEPDDRDYYRVDLLEQSQRQGLIDRVVERFGRLDILVNNAGFQFSESAETCTPEQWDASRSGLLDAVYDLSQQAIPHMKSQGGGKIINFASICAFREGGGNFSYGVMKAAVVGMTRCMANSVAKHGINVNAIAPGIIRTDLTAQCFEEERYKQLVTKYPAGRLGEPEDIVGPLLFLASDMSLFVHGQTLVVDGGFCGN
jgi:NAD(P)-dependent dehydrogenase (short-subunit alcohol dehydrogenase family)